jgi:uncharacterized protein with beta-barrel porin domain
MAAACTDNVSPTGDCDSLTINANTSSITITTGTTITGSWAVIVSNISLTTLNNAGLISGTDRGINSNSGGTIGTVNNTGSIEATNRAFENAFSSTIGTLNNNGTITADTIINNVLSSHVGLVNNNGTMTAGTTGFVNQNGNSIDTISNTGIITAGQYVLNNQGSVTTILNAGTISGSSYSIYNDTQGYIGTISNTGSLGNVYNNGRIGSIYNNGSITTLSNGQGGSGSTPLTYSGILPDQYDIIITSATAYGQLSATSVVTSKTTFGIDGTSSGLATTTYTAVLKGLSSSNLTSTTGVYGDYNWSLNETGTGTDIWNLVLTCITGHTCVSGSPALNLLQSMLNQGGPGVGAASVLNQLISGSPSGDMGTVSTAFSNLSGDAAIAQAVNQTLPTLTGDTTAASLQILNTTSQIVQARQGGLSGLSTGDKMRADRAVWLKPFGTWSNQGSKNGISGYNATTGGLIGGADTELSDALRAGAAFAYAHTNVNGSDDLNGVNINSYQAIGYGSYKLDGNTEANMQAGLGINRNDSSRIINFGGLDRTATASYDSYSFNLGTGIGQVYSVAPGTTLASSVRADYTLMQAQSYTESGAGGLNLNVGSQTVDQLVPALQVKLDQAMDYGFNLSANAGAGYDVLNGHNSVTSSYVGGGAAFVTQGLESSPWVIRSGLGLDYKPSDIYNISLRYDREDRGGSFNTQTASVKLRMLF